MDAKTYAKNLLKTQGKDSALRMVDENLTYSTNAWDTPAFGNEVTETHGEGRRTTVVESTKRKHKRLNRNFNFWKSVKIELKKLVK